MMQKKLKSSKIAAVLACLQLANPLVFAADSSADYNSQDFNKSYYANTETIKKAVKWESIALGLGTIGVISGIVLNDISNNHSFLEKIRYEFGKDYLKEFEELYNKSLSGHSVADCGRMLEFYNMHFVCLNNLNKSVFDSGFGLYVGHERNPFHVMEDGTYVFIPGADCTSFKEEYFFWKRINKEINHEIDNLRYSCSKDSNYKCDQLSLLSHSISHRLIILEQILENKYDIQGKYNEFGYDRNGYDRNGYDRDGYDRDGYNRKGYDKFGLNKEGKDRNGYYGSKQDRHLYDKFGYDAFGYDRGGYDRNGYDRNGFRRKCPLTLDAFEKLIGEKDTSSESGEELCNLFEENFAKAQIAGKTRESLEEEYKFWLGIIKKITRKFSGAIPDRNKWGYLRASVVERRTSLQQKINEMKRR